MEREKVREVRKKIVIKKRKKKRKGENDERNQKKRRIEKRRKTQIPWKWDSRWMWLKCATLCWKCISATSSLWNLARKRVSQAGRKKSSICTVRVVFYRFIFQAFIVLRCLTSEPTSVLHFFKYSPYGNLIRSRRSDVARCINEISNSSDGLKFFHVTENTFTIFATNSVISVKWNNSRRVHLP